MRIGEISEKRDLPDRGVKKRKGVSVKSSSFLETLMETEVSMELEEEEEERELEDILADLDEAGERLKDDPRLENLKRYRDLVKLFLKIALRRAYRVKEVMSRRTGKLFILVEKIDQALEELIERVLSQQFDAIWLASKLEEIRGLLIDIYQ